MNNFSKQKWMLLLLLLLLATNAATLIFMWLPKKNNNQPPPEGAKAFNFLIKELKMTDSQQVVYAQLRTEHQAIVRPLRQQLREAKDGIFDMLRVDAASSDIVNAAVAKPAAIQTAIDMATYQHFLKVLAICTPKQKTTFHTIIKEVIRQMAPPQGPPNRGNMHQPPPNDGPPSPE